MNSIKGSYILSFALDLLDFKLAINNFGTKDDINYIEFFSENKVTEKDFVKIEKFIKKVIDSNIDVNVSKQTIDTLSNTYLNSLKNYENKDSVVSFKNFIYPLFSSDLQDFKSNEIRFFKLLNVSGSYLDSSADSLVLTRIYFICSTDKNELEQKIAEFNQRTERDHRKISKDLDIFSTDLLTGQGMIIWHNNGFIIKNEIQKYIENKLYSYDFQIISTPILGSVDLYQKSGHLSHYKENMFPIIQIDNESLVLRPMTCPHHCVYYSKKQHSYKELPSYIFENSLLHRYEFSGSLSGLERVRSMLLPDTHIFCMPEQVEEVVMKCHKMIQEVFSDLKISPEYVSLSKRDPKDKLKFIDNDDLWNSTESMLRSAMSKNSIEFKEMVGEAAFYGPKLDYQFITAMNKEITFSTIQLDFSLPEKFNLEYKDKDGQMKRPVIIHLGIISTYERTIATLLEQTKGVLPLWLSPIQVMIIPIASQKFDKLCINLKEKLRKSGFRVDTDLSDERLSKKVRNSSLSKIPYTIVIGENEANNPDLISYRKFGSEELYSLSYIDFEKELFERLNKKI